MRKQYRKSYGASMREEHEVGYAKDQSQTVLGGSNSPNPRRRLCLRAIGAVEEAVERWAGQAGTTLVQALRSTDDEFKVTVAGIMEAVNDALAEG
jgi:hypothetical protein